MSESEEITEVLLEDAVLVDWVALDPRSVISFVELEALDSASIMSSINRATASSCNVVLEPKVVIRSSYSTYYRVKTAKYRSQEAMSSK